MWLYRYVPNVAQWLILLPGAVDRARPWDEPRRRHARHGRGKYNLLATVAILVVSLILAAASIDGWVIARYIGGRGIESTWQVPVFGRSLVFYFFDSRFIPS